MDENFEDNEGADSRELQEVDIDNLSDENKPKVSNTGRWTRDEHERFLQAMRIYGKDWDAIEEYVGTRDTTHCRSHA